MHLDSTMHTLVASVLFRANDRVLLVKEGKDGVEDTWDFPGGRVEGGEKPAQTAVREFREELGVSVDLDGIVGIYQGRDEFTQGPFVAVTYSGEVSEQPRVVPADTIQAVEWVECSRVAERSIRSPYVTEAISDAQADLLPMTAFKSVLR